MNGEIDRAANVEGWDAGIGVEARERKVVEGVVPVKVIDVGLEQGIARSRCDEGVAHMR